MQATGKLRAIMVEPSHGADRTYRTVRGGKRNIATSSEWIRLGSLDVDLEPVPRGIAIPGEVGQ